MLAHTTIPHPVRVSKGYASFRHQEKRESSSNSPAKTCLYQYHKPSAPFHTRTHKNKQIWLAMYHLMCEEECRKRYHFNSMRKNNILRARKYLNDVLLDQLPVLAAVQRQAGSSVCFVLFGIEDVRSSLYLVFRICTCRFGEGSSSGYCQRLGWKRVFAFAAPFRPFLMLGCRRRWGVARHML